MATENKAWLNQEGYIEIQLIGDQSEESFRHVYSEVLPLMDELQAQGKPLYCLFDLTRQTGFSLSSDRVAMELLEQAQYDRIAMYNVPHYEVTKGIIMATGKADKTKLFKSREEAVAWLNSPVAAQ